MTTPTKQSDTPENPETRHLGRRFLTRPSVLACAVILALVYGSLIPFDFAWADAVERSGGVGAALLVMLASPGWADAGPGASSLGVPFAISDLIVNLLLYVPLGAALRMALRARWRCWPIEVIGAALIGLVLSWSVESLQGLMPARVASLNDVAANSVGALVGALVALWGWGLFMRLSFALYCRLASWAGDFRRLLDMPGIAMLIAGVNAALIGLWYFKQVQESVASEGDRGTALPFERAFRLPYDLGVLLLGEALLIYAVIGCLLMLLTYTGARRLAMNWVVLGVVLIALAAELSRAVTQGAVPDITGPLLALSASAIMAVTVYTFTLAVRRSNRRHDPQPFDGPDRRNRPHDYV